VAKLGGGKESGRSAGFFVRPRLFEGGMEWVRVVVATSGRMGGGGETEGEGRKMQKKKKKRKKGPPSPPPAHQTR
jgi:hypothetical protein